MDYIDKALDKLREWVDKVMDALFGPQGEPDVIPIPVPVDDRQSRNRQPRNR
ncbi:MAG: hypothetical protein AAFO83_11895 [Cyanobacteria bacterium J06607_13]